MQWILDHLQFVVIGGLALAGFLKSRFDARNEQQGGEEPWSPFEESPERPQNPPRPYVPPPVTRMATPPPLRQATVAAAPSPPRPATPAMPIAMDDASAELRHQQQIADRLRALQENRAADALRAKPRERRQSTSMDKSRAASTSGLRKRLRTPAEIRSAIVLKEILDTPVGLR